MWGLLTSHPDVEPITREDFDPNRPSVVGGRRVTSETGAFVRYDDDTIFRVTQKKMEAFPRKMLVEKTPHHTLHIPRIRNLFPEAKLIYMMRDPRAVVSSVVHSTFFNFDRSVENAVRQYRMFFAEAAPYFASNSFLMVRYEDLMGDLASSLYGILEFLGLSTQPIARMMTENHGRVKVDIPGVFRRGTVDSYADDLTREQIEFIERELSDLLAVYYSFEAQPLSEHPLFPA
jgi:hypothetical protein